MSYSELKQLTQTAWKALFDHLFSKVSTNGNFDEKTPPFIQPSKFCVSVFMEPLLAAF